MTGKLRIQIKTIQSNLVLAGEAGLPHEMYLDCARLEDLMDMAARRGIGIRTWMDGSRLPFRFAEGRVGVVAQRGARAQALDAPVAPR